MYRKNHAYAVKPRAVSCEDANKRWLDKKTPSTKPSKKPKSNFGTISTLKIKKVIYG